MTRRTTSPHAGTGRGGERVAARARRLQEIRDLLGLHPRITGQHLADRLHCTIETIYRTVKPYPELHQRILANNPVPSAIDGWVCGRMACLNCGPGKRAKSARNRREVAA